MRVTTLYDALREAKRFTKRAERLLALCHDQEDQDITDHPKESGAVKRASMDLTRIPADPNAEITLLYPAIERDMKLEPRDAPQKAEERRQEIIANPNRRRRYEPPE